MADDQPNSETGQKNWRGVAASSSESEQKYGWQSDSREATPLVSRKASLKQRLTMLGFGLVTVILAAVFLVELLFSQVRTPLIVIAPSEYEFPYQPLSWSHEDLEEFRELDRETLNIQAIDSSWKTKDQGLRQLDLQLQTILRQRSLPASIVLYVRMHSSVDGSGVPCLVPPGANPFNADSWIPVKDLLQRFQSQNIPNSINKLVVFDCSSVLTDWSQGTLFNTFAARLPAAIREAAIPNLVVINAAGPAEVSATSIELQHGVFGHYLELGLAGAADRESGNSDRIISVRELHHYLLSRVNEWSLKNRGRPQQPQLMPIDPDDFSIAMSFNPGVRKHAKIESRLAASAAAKVSEEELRELWKKVEDGEKLNPLRFDPLTWTNLEQRVRWLESATASGEAYSKASRRIHHELQQRFAGIERSTDESNQGRQALARWASYTHDPLLRNSVLKMHSVPLAQFFDMIDQSSAENFRTIIDQFKRSPSASNLRDAIRALEANPELSQLEATCLLQLWEKYNTLQLWTDGSLLTSLIELHELAESASTPIDERSLEWIRPIIDSADRLRRRIDDQAFLGGNMPIEEISEAQQIYIQAGKIASDITRAYSARDRVDHELPYLTQWLLRPRFDGQGPSTAFLEFKSQILELMRNQRALERALSSPTLSAHGDSSQLPFEALLSNVESQHAHLRSQVAIEYERLLQLDDSSATAWNDIHDLLSIPILPPPNERLALSPSQQRNSLRERLTVIERKLADRFSAWTQQQSSQQIRKSDQSGPTGASAPTVAQSGSGNTGSMHMTEYLDELLIEVPEALALAVVRRDQGSETDDSSIPADARSDSKKHDIETIAEMQGTLFRQWMRSLSETVRDDTEQQLTSNENRVFQNSLGEKIIRAAATIAPIRPDNDPVVLRRNSDLQSLLLWHARRVKTDFWGSVSSEEASFFDSTSGHLMTMAESTGRTTTSSRSEIVELSSSLKKYRAAAASGLTTISDNLLIADDSEPAAARIAVYQNHKQDCLFPDGRAAVFVKTHQGERLGDIQQLTIPWAAETDPTSASLFTVMLAGLNHTSEQTLLKAVTSFRGHDYAGDLTVNSIAGIVVDYQPHALRESQVAIRGRKIRKLSIVFVLDCSNSMSREIPLEGDNRNAERLQVAKLALESMLDKLAEDETHRVGVICFGHRIGADLKQPGLTLKQTAYGAPIPDSVKPYDDVETILPLGRFNASFAGTVTDRLASIKPWGESPLYLAIIQALKMFDTDEPDSDRCVVVITDGLNYQFNAPFAARKSLYDVLGVWNDHRVPVHIVGLGISADQSAAAQREFGDLARKTGGNYVSAQESRTLVESLAALQRVSQFQVRSSSGLTVQQSDLGHPMTVITIPQQPNEFDVSLGTASEHITLWGGEALEFLPTRDERRLDVQPYDIGQPQFVPLVNDDKQNTITELMAGIHRPVRRGQNVTFEISVQHRERHFVGRPVEAWIEIVPMLRPGQAAAPTYLFYDANYVPRTTVPVLRWSIRDWPTEAVQAKVRFWCRYDDSKPTSTVLLRDVANPLRNPDFAVEGIPGVTARISLKQTEPLQISLVERHSQDSAGVGTLKVALKSNLIPSRIRHRFDAENHVATHFFEFPAGSDSVLNQGEFLLTTRAAAQEGALRIADTVVVDVTETGDVHD